MPLPASLSVIPAPLHAAVLLTARPLLAAFRMPCPSVDDILEATGAGRSRAYDLSTALTAALPALLRPRGRPAVQPTASVASEASAALSREVLRYVMRHPGCVTGGHERQRYSDDFRHFLIALRERHAAIHLDDFSLATDIPLGTLKDWLREPTPPQSGATVAVPARLELDSTPCAESDLNDVHLQTVLDAWARWEGGFVPFCEHVKRDLLIPWGRDLLRHVLAAHGKRTLVRRKGRGPDELALRGAFQTFFPGAQWVGDGMQIPVVVDEQSFVLNFELNVDTHTGACVGMSVRKEEDSEAVIEALQHGVAATGHSPIALLLDNKPSNHTAEVDAALGDTLRIRATVERPQNKAHVEGSFGLFSRVLPELVLDTRFGAYHVACALVTLVAGVWARTTNHRPRAGRGGYSRLALYDQTPTDEQIDEAKRALGETLQRQELRRRTLEARRRPEILALLDQSFADLQLLDPERHIRVAIAAFPRDAIVAGLAIFRAKIMALTLPDGADARYLLGIVKNVSAKNEAELFAEELYDLRIKMRERIFAPLIVERDALITAGDIPCAVRVCVDHALGMPPSIERSFWLDALATIIAAQPQHARRELFVSASRRIAATFAVDHHERQDAIRYVAERVTPLR